MKPHGISICAEKQFLKDQSNSWPLIVLPLTHLAV